MFPESITMGAYICVHIKELLHSFVAKETNTATIDASGNFTVGDAGCYGYLLPVHRLGLSVRLTLIT